MIKRIYILFLFFFFCVQSLSAQVEMKNFKVSKTPFKSNNHYLVRLKDSLSGCANVESAWFNVHRFEENKLLSPLFVKISELLEKEVYVKCDTNVTFNLFITYNKNNQPCDVAYRVPEEYFHCFSESFFDEVYSLIWTMSSDLPISTFLDILWARLSISTRERSTGYAQPLFVINKSMLDRIKNEYLKEH